MPEQKAGVKEEPPAKRRLRLGKLWWWMVIALIAVIGWQMWKLNAYNNAVREAKEAGFRWSCIDPISLIRQDWHNAFKKETWGEHDRFLYMGEVPDLGRYREMIHHLRPTILVADEFKDKNLDALKGLTALKVLELSRCTALQNVEGLKSLTSLQRFTLRACTELKNVDGIKGLTGLQTLFLIGCNKIPAAALRELRAALPNTDITFLEGTKSPPQ